ncbi:MAG TPA: hypothetical protein PLD25_19825 [Chloroflexota bacterium]|nr:hypothetical protein [Chloroflexota bacterium]
MPNISEAERERILAATVQIRLQAPLLDETGQPVLIENNGQWHSLETEARGLGTLVQMGDRVVVVTHDHWGELLETAVTAQFFNANGALLAEISGAVFRNLLHYRDQGTLLLAAPPELAFLVGVTGNGRELAVGSRVFLTRHLPGYEVVEVAVATVVTEREGIPAYLLQTADGTAVVPGDSGGGVWYEGQLAGNLWRNQARETVATTGADTTISQTVTDKSVAAAFTAVMEKIQPGDLVGEVQAERGEGVRP